MDTCPQCKHCFTYKEFLLTGLHVNCPNCGTRYRVKMPNKPWSWFAFICFLIPIFVLIQYFHKYGWLIVFMGILFGPLLQKLHPPKKPGSTKK